MKPVLLALLAVGVPALLVASSVTIPHAFSNAAVADAAQVNANFTAVKGAVDDNDARLDGLEARVGASGPGLVVDGVVRAPWDGAGSGTENHGFCVNGLQTYTRVQAATVCKGLGMRLCSVADLSAYGEAGAETCCWGWVADPGSNLGRTSGRHAYVMRSSSVTSGISASCGGNPGGVRVADNVADTTQAGAHCCR